MSALSVRQARDIHELARVSPFPVFEDTASRYRTVYCFMVGPPDCPYEGSVFALCVQIPAEFPMKSPSVAFVRGSVPYHSNIHPEGAICLNVLNKKWAPATRLHSLVDVYLPALFSHPEHEDPFNTEASAMALREPHVYEVMARSAAETNCVAHFHPHERPVLDPDVALEWLVTKARAGAGASLRLVAPAPAPAAPGATAAHS